MYWFCSIRSHDVREFSDRLLDACAGPANETFAMIVSDLGARLGIVPDFLAAVDVLRGTRMGLYTHEGFDGGGRTLLREITGKASVPCVIPAGYKGSRGDLVFTRLAPSQSLERWFSLTTPYVMAVPRTEWIEYLGRAGAATPPSAYERYMKFGPHPTFWPEYVFQAYVNHRKEAVYLTGIPDRPRSLPHSDPKRLRP